MDPSAADLDGVTLVTLDALGRSLAEQGTTAEVDAVRVIVAEEVTEYVAQRQAARVAPTVVALRTMADEVVAHELARLDARRPDLDPQARAELERTVRRVVATLLHAPTVRVKELAEEPAGLAYAEALHALFDLDPARYREVVVADVHAVEVDGGATVTARADACRAAGHPPQRARARPGEAGGRRAHGGHRARGRAGRGHHGRRHVDGAADPARRHRGVRVGAARRAGCPVASTSPCTR